MSISSSECVISVRRSSPKRSLISVSSSVISAITRASSPRMLPQLLDALERVRVLLLDLVGLERGEPLEAEVENRLRLDARELEVSISPSRAASGSRDARMSVDHLVELADRDEEALQDVQARLALAELVLCPADHHVALVVDVVLDHRQQAERARHVVDERHHVHAEGVLERRVLVEVVEHDLGNGVALQLDDQPDAGLVGLVPKIGDLLDALVVDLLRDLLDQPAAVVAAVALGHLVGHLGDDDRLLALALSGSMWARPRTTTRPRPVS